MGNICSPLGASPFPRRGGGGGAAFRRVRAGPGADAQVAFARPGADDGALEFCCWAFKARLVRGSSLAKFNRFAFSGPRFWSLAEGTAASSCSTKHAAGGPGCGLGASLYTLFAVGVFHY